METPFENDPFGFIWKAFHELYPDKKCKCYWRDDTDEYGYTEFYSDEVPIVVISANYPVSHQVEILSHELAHVAAGIDSEHGLEWENAFEIINQKYNMLIEEYLKREDE